MPLTVTYSDSNIIVNKFIMTENKLTHFFIVISKYLIDTVNSDE